MAQDRKTMRPAYRRLSKWVADRLWRAVLELSQDEWRAVLNGERLTRPGKGYWYEGEAFQDEWRFNADGPLTLEIGYDDGGTAFNGDVAEATIERYDADAGDFTDLTQLCLEFSSIDGLRVDIFEFAGLSVPYHLRDEAIDRLWSHYSPSTLFDELRSALIEEVDEVEDGAPGTNDVLTQVWAMDCLLLKAELRRFLEALLAGAE